VRLRATRIPPFPPCCTQGGSALRVDGQTWEVVVQRNTFQPSQCGGAGPLPPGTMTIGNGTVGVWVSAV